MVLAGGLLAGRLLARVIPRVLARIAPVLGRRSPRQTASELGRLAGAGLAGEAAGRVIRQIIGDDEMDEVQEALTRAERLPSPASEIAPAAIALEGGMAEPERQGATKAQARRTRERLERADRGEIPTGGRRRRSRAAVRDRGGPLLLTSPRRKERLDDLCDLLLPTLTRIDDPRAQVLARILASICERSK